MRSSSLLLALAFALIALGGCGESHAVDAQPLPPHELQASLTSGEVVQGHPFSLRVVIASEEREAFAGHNLHVGLVLDDQQLSGTRVREIGEIGHITFNDLIVQRAGEHTLWVAVDGLRYTRQAITINALPRLGLEFDWTPTEILRHQPFRVVVRARDQVTHKLSAPSEDMLVSLHAADAAHELQGTRAAAFLAGESTLVLDGLRYPAIQDALTLRAQAQGTLPATSEAIAVDGVRLVYAGMPERVTTGSPQRVSLGMVSILRNQAIYPAEPLLGELVSSSSLVGIAGQTRTQSAGAWLNFGELTLSGFGETTLNTGVPGLPLAISDPIVVAPDFRLVAQGPWIAQPGADLPAFDLLALDTQRNAFAFGPTSVEFRVINETSGEVLQTQTTSVTADASSLRFQPLPIEQSGAYRVAASVRVPGSTRTLNVNATLEIHSAQTIGAPGPFIAWPSTRQGENYACELPAYARSVDHQRYGLLFGELPEGLNLDPTSGAIHGEALERGSFSFTLYARAGDQLTSLRCALAVFSADDHELDNTLDYRNPGPLSVTVSERSFSYQSSFDDKVRSTRMLLYHPPLDAMDGNTPVFVMHRGRGLNPEDYSGLLQHIASHGILCVSVEDTLSFANRINWPQALPDYDSIIEMGMQSAAAALEGAIGELREMANVPADPLAGHFDPSAIIAGGHSRGGGATHALHTLAERVHLRGLVYLMGFDLRHTRRTTELAKAPVYPVPTMLPALPSLMISAQRDGDLVYPITDQLIDRATGPATFATIYGANHNQTADPVVPNDRKPWITRDAQQAWIGHLAVAFVKRWCDLRLDLDGVLYSDAYAGSLHLAVTTRRNMANALLVDDFQDDHPDRNALGGFNGLSGGTREESSFYPNTYGNGFPTLGLRHNVLALSQPSGVYQTTFSARDCSQHRELVFRICQDGLEGYSFASIDVRLRDLLGNAGNQRIHDRTAPDDRYLPRYRPEEFNGHQAYDRFVEVRIPLADLVEASDHSLDLRLINRVEIAFLGQQAPDCSIAIDDIRFE